MPRPILPPTPQSSVDLPPKPPPNLSSLELAFTLPPPALGSILSPENVAASVSKQSYNTFPKSLSPSSASYTPLSPAFPLEAKKNTTTTSPQPKKRRRVSIENPKLQPSPKQKPTTTEAITLPPPPTRNRKIIQMKPRQPPTPPVPSSAQQVSPPDPKPKSKKAALGSKLDKPTEDGKPTTAVGRKIARKTAHSLIERRRRFKMNEEFGVLKEMIPACTGVEMHKLAILQASIEYLKYLEQCVADLKASNSAATHQNKVPTLPPGDYDNDEEDDENDENDEEMADPESIDPNHEEQSSDELSNKGPLKHMQIEEQLASHPVVHSAPGLASPYPHSTKSQYSPTQSQDSPTYFPQAMSTTTSPNLYPQQYPSSEHGHDQIDTEATHALLLLADGSRRSSETARVPSPERRGRGMSVKELLSS